MGSRRWAGSGQKGRRLQKELEGSQRGGPSEGGQERMGIRQDLSKTVARTGFYLWMRQDVRQFSILILFATSVFDRIQAISSNSVAQKT